MLMFIAQRCYSSSAGLFTSRAALLETAEPVRMITMSEVEAAPGGGQLGSFWRFHNILRSLFLYKKGRDPILGTPDAEMRSVSDTF